MPLLMAFRRWWAFVFMAVLILPSIGFFAPDLPAPIRTVIAPDPQWWMRASERLDPYINNVFGFRGAVLKAHSTYGKWIGAGGGERVLEGKDGALFTKDEHAFEQSLGQLVRPDVVAGTVNVAAMLNTYMHEHGGQFLMVVPPNSQTINFDQLPSYAQRLRRSPTELDLLDADLKKRGIAYVDLRPLLTEARKTGPIYYKLDTHWNQRGAIMGFNAAMDALGHPELVIDAAKALRPPQPRHTGDLVRILGQTESSTTDYTFPFEKSFAKPEGLTPIEGVMTPVGPKDPFPPYAYTTGHAGPRIMVIGDSFTQGFWFGPLAARTSAFAWTHHRSCRFDMNEVRRFKPEILIFAPTERQMSCAGEVKNL